MWKLREAERFLDGTYTPICWNLPGLTDVSQCEDHFLHISTTHPNQVAYTPSETYGERDRQTRIRPGRYLSKFYGNVLTSEEIQFLVAEFSLKHDNYTLITTTSPDEIEQAYLCGPGSCMSHPLTDYISHIHPSRVYGNSPDIALAYITDPSGSICARCLIWPKKKIRSIIYGDYIRMIEALLQKGYDATHTSKFNGARISKIPSTTFPGRFVIPYIDNITTFSIDCNNYVFLEEKTKGFFQCCRTDGISGNPKDCECNNCGSFTFIENLRHVEHIDEIWCVSCITKRLTKCDSCGCQIPKYEHYADTLHMYLCGSCFSYYTRCENCDKLFKSTENPGGLLCNECVKKEKHND